MKTHTCSWCCLEKHLGEIRDDRWVCYTCFPPIKMENKGGKRRCSQCYNRTDEGGELSGSWFCGNCCPSFAKTKKKNKYAQYSRIDRTGFSDKPSVFAPKSKKKKRKERQEKKSKFTYWTVEITDISDGKL